MESINIFSMQMQMISLEWQYWLFLDWILGDWACWWLVRSNTSRTNYLQISPSHGQIYLQGKIFSNLVYLIKYQSRVGVTGRAQCHVTTAESAAPGMEAIFDRKCPPYSKTTLISSHIQYDILILVIFGCFSPDHWNSTNSFEYCSHFCRLDPDPHYDGKVNGLCPDWG